MPMNITFWCLPEDEKEFLSFIEQDNRVVALPLENSSPLIDKEQIRLPSQLIDKEKVSRMFLVLKTHLEQVKYIQYEKDGKTLFGIDAVNSPVVSYSRSIFREKNILGQGSISAYVDMLDANKKLVAKSDEFTLWAKKIISHARKKTPKWHEYKTYRITERVDEALREGLALTF
jgi:hypothetical protein